MYLHALNCQCIIFLFAVKQGTPTNDELEELGAEISEKWIKLGRRLHVKEPKLQEIDRLHDQLSEKGFHMLCHWKQEQGSAATYQALCDALRHKLVQRQDLAEQFCYFDGNCCVLYNIKLGGAVTNVQHINALTGVFIVFMCRALYSYSSSLYPGV